jgi:hypothetical protein
VIARRLWHELRAKGVTLALESDHIRYRAPRGAFTPELKERVKQHRTELMALLKAPADCTACRACGYWDRDAAGRGILYCFFDAVFRGKSAPAKTITEARQNCPRDEEEKHQKYGVLRGPG